MMLPAGTLLGPYEIVGLLGQGGMGVVYRALDTKLGRAVAVKVLPESLTHDTERRGRFQREAQILASLNHPYIAAIYGWEETSGQPALIMELVEGKPLNEHIPRHGMAISKALRYAVQIATGLEAAHRAGIIHRDLKPSNVMISSAGSVKLLDFGLAKLAGTATPSSANESTRTLALTQEGTVVGTAAYMSPEHAQGQPVDARSDLFSFGAVLYEMLTGRAAFQRDNTASTLAAILRDEPQPVGEAVAGPLPRDLEKIVRRCLRKDPERRFQSASDLRVALEELQEDLSSGRVEPAAPIRGRNALRWAWWGALFVLMLLAGAILWMRSRTPGALSQLRQQTFEAGVAIMPALSPDGKLLVYASDRAGDGGLDLWVKQVAAGDSVRLVSGMGSVYSPQFSADGTQVYYLGPQNDIFEVPTLGGRSRKIVDAGGPFSVSARGDIAFTQPSTGGGPSPMRMASADGASAPWQPDCLAVSAPTWSPDGEQLAFAGICNKQPGFFIAPRNGGTAKRLPGDSLKGTGGLAPGGEGPVIWSRINWYRAANGRESFVLAFRHGDTVNIYRLSLDGQLQPLTGGTGWEIWPSVSATGQIAFTRAENAPTIWSLPIQASAGASDRPRKEVAPGGMFAPSRDGNRLVYGRLLGTHKGEVVSRDTGNGSEIVLATYEGILPVGSLWVEISPDGSQAFYRALVPGNFGHYIVNTAGGAPRYVAPMKEYNLASGWFPDGRRVVGECTPTTAGICSLDTVTGRTAHLLSDSESELLYPSFSWDGKWLTFMRRRARKTAICITPVHPDGSFGGGAEWIEVSPPDSSNTRPRFAPDGNGIYYLWSERGVLTLVRQELDPATRRPRGEVERLARVQSFPFSLAYSVGATNAVIGVSRTRLFYNSMDVRGNIWMTSIE